MSSGYLLERISRGKVQVVQPTKEQRLAMALKGIFLEGQYNNPERLYVWMLEVARQGSTGPLSEALHK